MEEASESKREKYAELVKECQRRGVACTVLAHRGWGKGLSRKVTLQGLQPPGNHRSAQEKSHQCSVRGYRRSLTMAVDQEGRSME